MSGWASLEDLLTDANPTPRHRLVHWPRVIAAVIFSLVVGFIIHMGLQYASYALPYPLIAGGLFALIVLHWSVRLTRPPADASQEAVHQAAWEGQEWRQMYQGRAFGGVFRWQNRLNWTTPDRQSFVRTVHPVIVDLVDERLRQRYGIRRDQDPKRAQEVLGKELWDFLTTPPWRVPSPRRLAALVQRMETL